MTRFVVVLLCGMLGFGFFSATAQSEELTTEKLKAAAQELLDEFDGFKDSAVFARCTYGCGSENPAAAWDAKRRAINKQLTPQLDVPPRLKLAFGDMWQMGKDYAKGRKADANELRKEIEAALQ